MRAAVFSLALALVLVTATGCYSPTLVDGKAHCASGGVCPQGQYCAGNGLCYDNGHPPPDAGVPGDGGAQLLVPNARLSTVTPDETVLAYFTNTTSVEGTIVGDFKVAHMATPTTPLFTDHGAFEGMSPSVGIDAIYYFVSPAPSVDNGSNTVYGKLKVWTPTLTAPIVVSSGYATTYAIARDFSWVLFIDAAIPSATAVGNLVLARAQDCSGTVCPTTTLATNVVVAPSSVSYGNDPTYVAYVTQSGSTVVTYQVFLANTATGTTVPVGGSTTTIPWMNFTPDGSLLGIGTTTFTAIATATAQPAAWSLAPLGTTRVEVVAPADAQTFYIRVSEPSGTHIWKTTAAATTQLSTSAASYFQIPITSTAATASGRYLFSSTASAVGDLEVYDLQAASPTPIPIATAADNHAVGLAFDHSLARFFEHYSATTGRGDITTVELPPSNPPLLHTVLANVSEGAVTFANSSDDVVYIDETLSLARYFDGVTTPIANGVTTFRIRSTPTQQLYFSNSSADTLHGLVPGIYVMPLP